MNILNFDLGSPPARPDVSQEEQQEQEEEASPECFEFERDYRSIKVARKEYQTRSDQARRTASLALGASFRHHWRSEMRHLMSVLAITSDDFVVDPDADYHSFTKYRACVRKRLGDLSWPVRSQERWLALARLRYLTTGQFSPEPTDSDVAVWCDVRSFFPRA